MTRVWCMDCKAERNLNTHLRCEVCNSDAVDTLERLPFKQAEEVQELAWIEAALQGIGVRG